jgi:DNA-binding IclR family transcriptional regulator
MWARVGTAPAFVLARDAIVAALEEGPMNVPELAKKTGKAKVSITKALQEHLLPDRKVIRTKRGVYALPGAAPYIPKRDAIIGALKSGLKTVSELVQETGTPLASIYQFIRPLIANGKVIRTKWGTYALADAAPVYVTTRDAAITALRRKPVKFRPLLQHINKSTNSARSPNTLASVLGALIKRGMVKQDRRGGEYRLARRARSGRGAHSTARRKVARRRIAAGSLHP